MPKSIRLTHDSAIRERTITNPMAPDPFTTRFWMVIQIIQSVKGECSVYHAPQRPDEIMFLGTEQEQRSVQRLVDEHFPGFLQQASMLYADYVLKNNLYQKETHLFIERIA